jgi:predicted phosphodiesterase
MLIGIVADIHDAVEPLRKALSLLRERGVERIVTLGDAFDSSQPGESGAKVASLLQDADAIGVWESTTSA